MTDAATEEHYRQAEHARSSAMSAAVLAVEAALTEEERAQILAATAGPGTSLHGAAVADVLDILANHDAHLEWTEPFYDSDPRLLAVLYAAIDYDPEADLPGTPEGMYGQYLRGIVLSRAVLARALLMRERPDVQSVTTLAAKALEAAHKR